MFCVGRSTDEASSSFGVSAPGGLSDGGLDAIVEMGGGAISRDNPGDSELIYRIESDDPDDVMPPPEIQGTSTTAMSRACGTASDRACRASAMTIS